MRCLLDTHTLIWWVLDDPRLGGGARDALTNRNNVIFVSAISAFEIGNKHRLGKLPEVHALLDGQRAIRLVRSGAAEFGVNPCRVGIMGFSAGAHVAVMAATHYDAGQPEASDPIERQGCRPDFQALIYGGAGSTNFNKIVAFQSPYSQASLLAISTSRNSRIRARVTGRPLRPSIQRGRTR